MPETIVSPRLVRVKRENFGSWQPKYAEHNLVTFPVEFPTPTRKKPLINNPGKIGLSASNLFASQPRFASARGIGLWCGKRNNLTILDIDAPDERLLADRLQRHGQSKIIARTPSGKFHVWYKHNGEPRLIKPWGEHEPVDLLGSNLCVLPPSLRNGGRYEFIEGNLDNLCELQPVKNIDDIFQPGKIPDGVYDYQDNEQKYPDLPLFIKCGARNTRIWRCCMRKAWECSNLQQLIEYAKCVYETSCDRHPIMEDKEIMKIAESAWGYTESGRNWFTPHHTQHGVYLRIEEVDLLIEQPDVRALLVFLRRENGPHGRFMIANALHKQWGWSPKRLAKARNKLIELGYVRVTKPANKQTGPALHAWLRK
jgi:hypothetical protein